MTTIRIKHAKNYTSISNAAIRDKRLSFRARGLHHLLLSYPDNWTLHRDQLSEQSDKEGRDSIVTALKELKEFGYVQRQRTRDPETGKLDWENIVYELPPNGFSGNGFSGNGSSSDGFSGNGEKGQNSNGDELSEVEPSDGFSGNGFSVTSDGLSSDGLSSDGFSGTLISNVITNTDLTNTNTKEGEFKNLHSGKSDPVEPLQQSSLVRIPEKKPLPDQASRGSTQATSSAAAPLIVENPNHSTVLSSLAWQNKGHKYPDLIAAGLGHVWIGPGWTDFLPELIESCSRYLRSLDKPCERGNGINYLKNLIRNADWAAIELRLQSMDEYLLKRQSNNSQVNQPVKPPEGFEGNPGTYRYHTDENAPKAFVDMTPDEQQVYKAAIAAMKVKTAGLEFSSLGEAIASSALGVAS